MAYITIGTATPSTNPAKCTLIRPDKLNAVVLTYTGVAYFAWAASIVGKILTLEWDSLKGDEFAEFDVIFQADTTVTFDPFDGSNLTFQVKMIALDGDYFIGLGVASTDYRQNVKMKLLILSQATKGA